MYFAAALVASLVVSASALATPRVEGLSRRHHHAALAKRAPAPEPVAQPLDASAAVPKRQLKKRCKPRRTSSTLAASPTSAPVNVAPLPVSIETTFSAPPSPAPSHSSSQSHSSSKEAPPPPPKPTHNPAPPSGGDDDTQSSSLFSGTNIGGDGTFYGTGLGACGITNKDTDLIAAVPFGLFDKFPGYNGVNPNQNPICGKKVRVEFQGKSVVVVLTDRCAGCFNDKSLDFSPAAFNLIADPALGRIHDIKYTWL